MEARKNIFGETAPVCLSRSEERRALKPAGRAEKKGGG